MDYEYGYQYDPQMMVEGGSSTAIAAIAIGFLAVFLVVGIAFYIYFAVCLMKIAKKTGTDNGWFAWIPILNVILMLQVAKKPIWWLILFFIPGINLVFTILVWMEIAKAVGKPEWWGILMIVPFVNLVVPGYLAFSGNKKELAEKTPGSGLSDSAEEDQGQS